MGEYENFMAEAREELEKIKSRNENQEIKAQRATVPSMLPPGYTTSEKRTIELGDADKSFLRFIRTGDRAGLEQKALVEDATGQILVSPMITAEIERSVAKLVVMRSLCDLKVIDKDRLQVRAIDEAAVSWGKLETGSEITESTLTPATPNYKYVEDLYGLSKIGEDELMDADADLASILADSFARALVEAEETAFVTGLGHDSQQPEGFITNATFIAATITTAAAGAITIEELLDMVYNCPSKFRKGASFLVHSLTALELRKLRTKDGSGTYEGSFLWQPSTILGQPPTLLGYPAHTQDDLATLAGTEGVIAAFGDFRAGYRILDRVGMTVQRLVELYAEAGLVGFKIHKRVGGYVQRASDKPIVLLTEHA